MNIDSYLFDTNFNPQYLDIYIILNKRALKEIDRFLNICHERCQNVVRWERLNWKQLIIVKKVVF